MPKSQHFCGRFYKQGFLNGYGVLIMGGLRGGELKDYAVLVIEGGMTGK